MPQQQTTARTRTDEELIEAFQKGDSQAYDLLVGRYKDHLVNFAFRFLGEYDGADEVAQETLIRVYRKRNSYKPIAKFSTWIYTIATNLAKSELRRRKRHGIFSLSGRGQGAGEREYEPADDRNPADGQAARSLQAELIQEALDSLPVKYREVVVLRYIQEMSYEEICEISHTTMGTVKSRLNRARLRLQELLKDSFDEE